MTDDDVKAVVRAIKESMAESFAEVGERFDAMEQRQGALEVRLDQELALLNAKVDLLLDTIERGFIVIGARLDSLDQRVGSLERRLGYGSNGNGKR